MCLIELKNVSKEYEEGKQVLNAVSLCVNEGEFLMLVGPSGGGKTTLLKMINGLLTPDQGEVIIEGQDIKSWDINKMRQGMGYVVQENSLFPHMNVFKNITYVPSLAGMSKEERKKRAEELIELVGLDDSYLSRYPRELSGGEAGRVNIGRGLGNSPKILLMDEPFSALDEYRRNILQQEISEIQEKLNLTIIFVTHDLDEAIKLGSRILFLSGGHITYDKQKGETRHQELRMLFEAAWAEKH